MTPDPVPGAPQTRAGRTGAVLTRWLPAVLLATPLLEILVGVQVALRVGTGPTLLAILLGCALGIVVLRREGRGALGDFQAARRHLMEQAARASGSGSPPTRGDTVRPDGTVVSEGSAGGGGRPRPSRAAGDRALVVLAGLLLVFPGLVTDVLGLVLLIPGVRGLLRRRAASAAARRGWTTTPVRVVRVEVRDVEVRDVDPGSSPEPGRRVIRAVEPGPRPTHPDDDEGSGS